MPKNEAQRSIDSPYAAARGVGGSSSGGGSGVVTSVNSEVGDVILDMDDIGDGATNKGFTSTEKTKLAGVEDGADVTDAVNVGAAIGSVSADDTIDDTDELAYVSGSTLKKSAWSNIKSLLTTLFNTLFVRQDGTTPLTADWDIGEDRRIKAEAIRARDNEGIRIEEAAGNLGLFVQDATGNVGVKTASPTSQLDVLEDVNGDVELKVRNNNAGASARAIIGVYSDGANESGIIAVTTPLYTALPDWADALTTQARSGLSGGYIIYSPVKVRLQNTAGVDVLTLISEKVGINQVSPTASLHIVQVLTAGEALRITRDLAAASTDSPLANLIQDNSGDDQGVLRLQQDGTGYIAELYDGATVVLRVNDGGRLDVAQVIRALTSSGLQLQDDGGNVGVTVADGGAVDIPNPLTIKPGTASDTARVGGVLYVSATQVGNVGTGEDNLVSFSVPANTLAVDGQSVWLEASGKFVGNANAKTLRVRFGDSGTTLIVDTGDISTGAAANWFIRAEVFRTGAATQKAWAEVRRNDTGVSSSSNKIGMVTALNQTLSGAVNLRVTAEAVSNDDIVVHTVKIGWSGENS